MPAKQKIIKKTKYNFAIIGAGMVGTAIGVLLKKAGNSIICVCDKSPASLKRAAKYIKSDAFQKSLDKAGRADCLLITTPDDAISSACRDISCLPDIKGKFVFHMSGAGGLNLLDTAAASGAFVGSIHPLQSFSSIENAMVNIEQSYFGVTASGKAKTMAKNIVADLKGIPLFISDKQKPLYHAAACFASNYLVTLLHAVESLYQATGIKEKQARQAYLPLVYGTLKNIQRSGSVQALTGPIARGDTGTIKKHMETIQANAPLFAPLYSALGITTAQLARQKGTINPSRVNLITDILKGVKK
jgi:predicted short-subunit dehydrogenase-like oxidoreductase (DUF2520 family)